MRIIPKNSRLNVYAYCLSGSVLYTVIVYFILDIDMLRKGTLWDDIQHLLFEVFFYGSLASTVVAFFSVGHVLCAKKFRRHVEERTWLQVLYGASSIPALVSSVVYLLKLATIYPNLLVWWAMPLQAGCVVAIVSAIANIYRLLISDGR